MSIFGKEVRDWVSDIYEKIGVSFELPNHYPDLTAIENLDYFASLYTSNCYSSKEVLELVGLRDEGNKKVKHYCKSMKIRINVARSMLHKPEILYLKEPTSGLDPINARIMKDLILKLRNQGATIFITIHNMSVADELCNQVAFISDVKLIEELPTITIRSNGSAIGSSLNGHFKTKELGSILLFVDIDSSPFIYMETTDEK